MEMTPGKSDSVTDDKKLHAVSGCDIRLEKERKVSRN